LQLLIIIITNHQHHSLPRQTPELKKLSIFERLVIILYQALLFNFVILQLISKLEDSAAALEAEKKSGIRPIDDIEAEIKLIKEQIKQHKRNHINFFYYF